MSNVYTFPSREAMRVGTQGSVWLMKNNKMAPTVLKIHNEQRAYAIEQMCYMRLRDYGVTHLEGFHVPLLIHCERETLVLEMTMVRPPYLLDFAQAYLDSPPDYSEEVWAETRARWSAAYGDEWPRVQRVLAAMEELGIYYEDVHRGNLAL